MAARILIVDDSASVLGLTRDLLESAGYRVSTTQNPMLVACEIRREMPDLILLDVEMPGLTGTAVLATLRRYLCCPNTRIVLFSSLEAAELERLAVEFQASGWIHKGSRVQGGALVREVRRFLVDVPAAGPPRRGMALVVDDSTPVRRSLAQILEGVGFEVREAAHGAAALEHLDGPLQLALVDLHMPEMDGCELIRRIRGGGGVLPVLMVSSETDPHQIARGIDAGADEYLMKPFSKESILEKLQMLGLLDAGA
ncbi:MAG: response regulator [Planctomycetota bacterium]